MGIYKINAASRSPNRSFPHVRSHCVAVVAPTTLKRELLLDVLPTQMARLNVQMRLKRGNYGLRRPTEQTEDLCSSR